MQNSSPSIQGSCLSLYLTLSSDELVINIVISSMISATIHLIALIIFVCISSPPQFGARQGESQIPPGNPLFS